MYRIDNETAVAVKPTKEEAGDQGYWSKGDPTQGIPATIMDQDWLNMVQDELKNAIEAGGLTPSKADDSQLSQAIQALILASGGGSSIGEDFYQPAHGLAKLNAVYHNGSVWVKGQADVEATSIIEGVVDEVIDVDNIKIKYGGIVEWDDVGTPDFTVGNRVYLSNTTAGGLVDTKPTYAIGEVDKLAGYALPTGLLVAIDKGDVVGEMGKAEVGKTADYTILPADTDKLFYVEDTVDTILVFDFDPTFPNNRSVYLYCDSALTTTDDQTVHLNVQTSVGNYTKLFKGDGVYKVTKSALTGTYLFARA